MEVMRDTLLIQADKSMFMSEFGNVIMTANDDTVFLFNDWASRERAIKASESCSEKCTTLTWPP